MKKFFTADNGMTLTGQGPKIIRMGLPFAVVAILLQLFYPDALRLPMSGALPLIIGITLLAAGVLLWGTGLLQLLKYFPKGRLVTNGAYAFCRNPLYASFILLIVPGIAFITCQWSYFVAALAIWVGCGLFVDREERELAALFGEEYAAYARRVNRIFPRLLPVRYKGV